VTNLVRSGALAADEENEFFPQLTFTGVRCPSPYLLHGDARTNNTSLAYFTV
ncbi:hypothetical protein KUDE01_005582, partial [Dissostichus eleginoides]